MFEIIMQDPKGSPDISAEIIDPPSSGGSRGVSGV